ncbi:MAG: hypothetical protein HWN68_17880 [Desulfobacterales bacterium]|nr:hypothetical protein [Desulfobacterales bacterium]
MPFGALKYYEAGADGLCFWDSDGRARLTKQWSTLRRLGHLEEIKTKLEEEPELTLMALKTLFGYKGYKYHPIWGHHP